ncbi:hypothetical protein PR003_g16446 [Phytophthora rubi]|uniref:Uncharacterized protein n=1 Tax=Phytophthora rubi TaxID=129364 RepID=A0A6A4EX35_9STRA|nr:hypothetical protein PR003_g16446 [Phytophthora rubi]
MSSANPLCGLPAFLCHARQFRCSPIVFARLSGPAGHSHGIRRSSRSPECAL